MAPKTVLFLSSNQPGRAWLNVDREVRRVSQALEESLYSPQIHFRNRPAVQVTDLGPALVADRPAVVHFSGHGHLGGRLVLFNQDDHPIDVDPAVFASVLAGGGVELVVLNACFSAPLADTLVSAGVRFVVGAEGKIPDEASLAFSEVLYRILARGAPLQEAFAHAVDAAKLQLPGDHRFRLVSAPGAEADRWKLVEPPKIRSDRPPLQVVLVLDVYGDGRLAKVIDDELPDRRQDRVILRLSEGAGSIPRLLPGHDPRAIDWRALGNAVEDLARRLRQRLAENTHPVDYYVCGEAPLPVFAHLGFVLSAWTDRITSFNYFKLKGLLLELPLGAPSRAAPLFARRGLDGVSVSDGRVAVYVSAGRLPDPEIDAKMAAHLQARGEPLAGIVALTTEEELNSDNIGSCARELMEALSRQLPAAYPRARGVDLFVAGPVTLALCAGRAINPNQLDLAVAHYIGPEYVPAIGLPWRGGPAAPPSMEPADQMARERILREVIDAVDALRGRFSAEHVRLPAGLLRSAEEERQIAASLVRRLGRLQVEREPAGQGFHLDPQGRIRFGHDLLEALRQHRREVRTPLIQLFLLHELFHYDQGIRSSNYRGVGRAELILEEVDYWADAFALLTRVSWEIERGGADAAERCSERLVESIDAHLGALALFDRMEHGDVLLDLPVRRIRRYLIWHLQRARARTIASPDHVAWLLGSRLFVELAPLNDRHEQPQLFVAHNGRMSRDFRSPDNFEPAALLRAIREGDRDAIGQAMDYVVEANAALLTPWER